MLTLDVTRFRRIRIAGVPAASCAGSVVAALLLFAGTAAATTYKWTDANGRVIYSDQPPTGNFKVEALDAPPPPADPNAARDLANKEAELQKRRSLRTEEEGKAAKTRVEDNLKREQCQRARGQVIALTQSDQVVIYTTNAQGQRTAMDNAARLREVEVLQASIRQNCMN